MKVAKVLPYILLLLAAANVLPLKVYSWGNGGYSADPANPRYGTHDWIAHHALDWLPDTEKKFILENLAVYLYGTELPDNGRVPDGIGDTYKHHVYFYANGFLQDDVGARRAQQEYDKALYLYKTGQVVEAVKHLGAMAHYIADLAVFGHVMGFETDWGEEQHHKDYEDYVEHWTNSYYDDFNVFLKFDGTLEVITAYEAALRLAYDTTFDLDGELTCVWMDANYNWGDETFLNRCGKSLNLAVNLIADVLHTFALEIQHHIPVPFHYQIKDYYCGPACLEMVFDYYGEDISQTEIADVARTIGEPVYSTFRDELRRAAHFSNTSTSMGAELDYNIAGYTLRSLGYAAFESFGMTMEDLKRYVDMGKPLILLMRYSESSERGHYRVLTGYNETHFFLHDPWNKPEWGGEYGGPSIALKYTTFLELWEYSGCWALYVEPWRLQVSAPAVVTPGEPFKVNVTITYPELPPRAIENYTAYACNATIILPPTVMLADGEVARKTVRTGFLKAGESTTVSWTLVALTYPIWGKIAIEAEGLVYGLVETHLFPPYRYADRIGAKTTFAIGPVDNTPPTISTAVREPTGDVMESSAVTVLASVTDKQSGVAKVILSFTVDNGANWENLTMSFDALTGFYEAVIPGQKGGTTVRFKIIAYDVVGNTAVFEEPYCVYVVISPLKPIYVLIFLATISTITSTLAHVHKVRGDKQPFFTMF